MRRLGHDRTFSLSAVPPPHTASWLALTACLAGLSCAGSRGAQTAEPPDDASAALRPFYAALAARLRPLPVAPRGAPLPAATRALTTIALGSCNDARKPIPILRTIAARRPDLFVYMGDNVYGDTSGDMTLPELRAQYAALAAHPDFLALAGAVPIVATWDDHDYGLNDAGGDFTAREWARTLFGAFWHNTERLGPDGVYQGYTFGAPDQRVQLLLLDTRSARSSLVRRAERSPTGPYQPDAGPDARVLSEAQWTWLTARLREPAALHLVVSSIQVLADGHDFEAWDNFTRERARLLTALRAAGGRVVLVSGDRHVSAFYRDDAALGYPLVELTSSALNLTTQGRADERSPNQITPMLTRDNFGVVRIDWATRRVTLELVDQEGQVAQSQSVELGEGGE